MLKVVALYNIRSPTIVIICAHLTFGLGHYHTFILSILKLDFVVLLSI